MPETKAHTAGPEMGPPGLARDLSVSPSPSGLTSKFQAGDRAGGKRWKGEVFPFLFRKGHLPQGLVLTAHGIELCPWLAMLATRESEKSGF